MGNDGPIQTALMRSPGGLSADDRNAAKQIRDSIFAQASIDDLLNEWRDSEHMLKVGKIAIANAILTAERQSALGVTANNDPDQSYRAVSSLRGSWLGYLITNLKRELPRRAIDQIFSETAFIVFNYDRCIEQFLYCAFQRVAGLNPGNAALAVSKIPIVHVYGSVGRLPFESDTSKNVPFGSEQFIHSSIYERIKTYTEEYQDTENLNRIHSLMSYASTVIFLGFGYHARNMDLLFPTEGLLDKCRVWGTCHDVSQTALNQNQSLMENLRTRPQFESFKCSDFFKNYGSSIF